jgi:hypothetical protein
MRHLRRRGSWSPRSLIAIGAVLTTGVAVLAVALVSGLFDSPDSEAVTASSTPTRPASQPSSGRDGSVDGEVSRPLSTLEPISPAPSRSGPRARRSGACPAAPDTPGGADPWGGCWPGPGNTGVPAGTALAPYSGPCDIRANNVVIEAKIVNCGGMLVYGSNLTIRKSKVFGFVKTNSGSASMLIEDSEIDGQDDHSEALGIDNVTVIRSNIHGDQHSVHCGDGCTIRDSWLHDQHDGAAEGWHQNAFITNGGSNHLLRHNSLNCRGGCTADLALIPDDDISGVTVDRNLLVASPDSAYCVYGGGNSGNKPGRSDHVVYTDNVFQRGPNGKCATYGPVTYFDPAAAGNRWVGNEWADGTSIAPEN